MRVEAELPLSRVTFPAVLDHAWGFSTSAIHARPMSLNVDGTVSDDVARLEEASSGTLRILLNGYRTWTDGRVVEFDELARTIMRGLHIAPHIGRVFGVSAQALLVESDLSMSSLKRAMASSAFSITPCVRDDPSRATSGTFELIDIREQGRLIDIAKRTPRRGQSVVTLVATTSARAGDELYRANGLDVTRVLGGYRETNEITTPPLVDYVMGIRSAVGDRRATKFGTLLDQTALAAATGRTYQAWTNDRCPGVGAAIPDEIELTFTDFYPNHEVAVEIARQLGSVGVQCHVQVVSYADYLTREVVPGEFRLEIVDSLFGLDDSFAPLLRGRATSRVRAGLPAPVDFINARAEYDWSVLVRRDRKHAET